MFKQRLLTALVLIPLVLFAIYYSTSWVFSSLILIVMLFCGFEWLQLIPINQPLIKFVFIALLPLLFWSSHYDFYLWFMTGLLFWAFILVAVVLFPASQSVWGYPVVVGIMGLVLLPVFAQSMVKIYLFAQGKDLVVYLLLLMWAVDTGAYFVGKQWGFHKLIPRVSPGKTIEGALGGIVLATMVAVVGYFYFEPKTIFIHWLCIAFAVMFVSMLGDLSISMLKRRSKLKDTGHLLPGHGGILDRLDSLIAAAPLFYYGLWLSSRTI